MSQETSRQHPKRNKPPTNHPVDTIDSTKQIRRYDFLPHTHSYYAPNDRTESINSQQCTQSNRMGTHSDSNKNYGVDAERTKKRNSRSQYIDDTRTEESGDYASNGGRSKKQTITGRGDAQLLGCEKHECRVAKVKTEGVDPQQYCERPQQPVADQPEKAIGNGPPKAQALDPTGSRPGQSK
ncbi:hypothetical protein GCM10009602_32890 [Nocardiopsis tropica]